MKCVFVSIINLFLQLTLYAQAQQLDTDPFGPQQVIIEAETEGAVDIFADDLDNDGDLDGVHETFPFFFID